MSHHTQLMNDSATRSTPAFVAAPVTDISVVVIELHSGVPVRRHGDVCPLKHLPRSQIVVPALHYYRTPVISRLHSQVIRGTLDAGST